MTNIKSNIAVEIQTSMLFNLDFAEVLLYTPLSVNAFPNKLAANVPNNIERYPHFCSFISFLIASLILCISNSDSASDLTIFMMSSISSFEIIYVVVPDP